MARHPLRMTIHEVCADLRREGIPVTEKYLADGILAGEYPFGRLLREGPTGRRTFIIERKLYESWKQANLT